ncbi:MAG: inositol monophosphatase [Kiritimatiellae bacterium]|nr:inositol monophosphatase [Kiritimatiellia bacterium]
MIPSVQLLAVASFAARRAGQYVVANLSRRDDVNKASREDVKHKLDVESQRIIEEIIRTSYPDHAILGEESADRPEVESDYRWIVDPIDGTVNFFHGFPWWNCSVAVWYRGRAVAGAVFAPELGKLYEATADGPALCNGVPIHVSDTENPELAMFATGADKHDLGGLSFRGIRRIAETSQRARLLGSAALDICHVAEGRLDGYFESGIYLWDMAAASLILERAGGTCSILKDYGTPKYHIAFLATNGKLHDTYTQALLPLL